MSRPPASHYIHPYVNSMAIGAGPARVVRGPTAATLLCNIPSMRFSPPRDQHKYPCTCCTSTQHYGTEKKLQISLTCTTSCTTEPQYTLFLACRTNSGPWRVPGRPGRWTTTNRWGNLSKSIINRRPTRNDPLRNHKRPIPSYTLDHDFTSAIPTV